MAMDVRELVYGGYYFNEKGKVEQFELRPIQLDYFDEWKPIPLTEEWLLKFGFKKSYILSPLKTDSENVMDDDREYIDTYEKEEVVLDGNHCLRYYYGDAVIVKHVHQLQILYFALTGEELEIKSPSPNQINSDHT